MPERSKKNILYISAWYPHRYDSMMGLFVKNHAIAASRFCNIAVLFSISTDQDLGKTYDVDIEQIDDIKTVRVYFKKVNSNIPFFSNALRAFRYFNSCRKGLMYIKKDEFYPDLVHVNILTRAGLIALWLKCVKSIP